MGGVCFCRNSLAEQGNETATGIPGKSWDLLPSVEFQASSSLIDFRIEKCWCKPARSPGKIALTLQASRKISTLSSEEMHWCRGLKPQTILAFWGKSGSILILSGHALSEDLKTFTFSGLETLRHPFLPAGFCKSLTSCFFFGLVSSAAVWSLHASCAVALCHQPVGTEDQCGLFLVKSWSTLS